MHRRLAEARDDGAAMLAMEVSSHALDQGRVGGVRFDTAVFTNLSRDHLDYHGTIDAYGAAKARLFRSAGLRCAVVNVQDAFGRQLAGTLDPGVEAVWFSTSNELIASPGVGWIRLSELGVFATGLTLHVESSWGAGTLRSRLVGAFNAENLLATLGVLLGWRVPLQKALAAVAACHAPPGRMEVFGGGAHPLAIVDYAHTPDALAKLLDASRAHARGRLICVFGCGGDRDTGKRPQMGAIAEALADAVVLTSDNPRTEDPQAIIAADRRRHAAGRSGRRDPGPRSSDPPCARGRRARRCRRDRRKGARGLPGRRARAPSVQRPGGRARGVRSCAVIRDLASLAAVTGGVLHGVNAPFRRVVSDSRSIDAGDLFVALRGEHYDAHDFVPDVVARGAAGALVNRLVSVHVAQVVVPDVLSALTDFARAWRRDFGGPVVGITGSNGKTTVKEMTGAILGRGGPCLVTQGNLNNHIGVPLTLARLEPAHRCAVVEMGANHPGEIAHLAGIALPTVGLVINAGPAHLEGFGGIEGVARAKGEMFEALGGQGTAVINADDPLRGALARARRPRQSSDHVRDARAGGFSRHVAGNPPGEGPVRDRVRSRLPAR